MYGGNLCYWTALELMDTCFLIFCVSFHVCGKPLLLDCIGAHGYYYFFFSRNDVGHLGKSTAIVSSSGPSERFLMFSFLISFGPFELRQLFFYSGKYLCLLIYFLCND